MQALTFQGIKSIQLSTVPLPVIEQPTDVIVRVTLAALCGSDVHLYTGNDDIPDPGTVMGHEFVGLVHDVGPEVKNLAKGDRVVCPFTTSCGECFFCTTGLTARCEKGCLFGWKRGDRGIHGGQAQFVRVPLADATLVKLAGLVPELDEFPDEKAVLLGDIIPTGLFCAENAGVCGQAGSDVCVIVGCGPVGLMTLVACVELGARKVFVVDGVPERLAMAERFGGSPLNFREVDVEGVVKGWTEERGADCVMEVVGAPSALTTALRLVRAGGTISSIGVYGEGTAFPFHPVDLYNKNVTFKSGRCPARRYLDNKAVAIAAKYDVQEIVSHKVGLEAGPEMYEVFSSRREGCVKVVFDPWRGSQQ